MHILSQRRKEISGVIKLESLLYFHPAPEGMYQKNAARRHWWQDVVLTSRELPAKEREPFFLLVDCPVPRYFYQKKPWPCAALTECMADVVYGAAGMADAWLHPDIMTLVSEEERGRWEAGPDTVRRLLSCLVSVFAADRLQESGAATVLLGRAGDTLWQMEMTGQVLAPYLPRINRLTFYYEEAAGIDLWEEAAEYLEAYSYEYGLTPALASYRENGTRTADDRGARGKKAQDDAGGLILDYGAPVEGRWFQGRERAVYVDLQTSPVKERKCLAKDGRLLYVSPLKYLDTVVKSEYDRKD